MTLGKKYNKYSCNLCNRVFGNMSANDVTQIEGEWYHKYCLQRIITIQRKYHIFFDTFEHRHRDVWQEEKLGDDPKYHSGERFF